MNQFLSTIEINAMEGVFNDTRDETFGTLEISQPERKRRINLQCKVDTGAQSNVSSIRLLCMIAPEKFDDGGNPKPEAILSIWWLHNQAAGHCKYTLQIQREED